MAKNDNKKAKDADAKAVPVAADAADLGAQVPAPTVEGGADVEETGTNEPINPPREADEDPVSDAFSEAAAEGDTDEVHNPAEAEGVKDYTKAKTANEKTVIAYRVKDDGQDFDEVIFIPGGDKRGVAKLWDTVDNARHELLPESVVYQLRAGVTRKGEYVHPAEVKAEARTEVYDGPLNEALAYWES